MIRVLSGGRKCLEAGFIKTQFSKESASNQRSINSRIEEKSASTPTKRMMSIQSHPSTLVVVWNLILSPASFDLAIKAFQILQAR
jgi:hypothetical protein